MAEEKKTLYCSFCGKSQHDAGKIIAGPTVSICDECVVLCLDILNEESKQVDKSNQFITSGGFYLSKDPSFAVSAEEVIEEIMSLPTPYTDKALIKNHLNDFIMRRTVIKKAEVLALDLTLVDIKALYELNWDKIPKEYKANDQGNLNELGTALRDYVLKELHLQAGDPA